MQVTCKNFFQFERTALRAYIDRAYLGLLTARCLRRYLVTDSSKRQLTATYQLRSAAVIKKGRIDNLQ